MHAVHCLRAGMEPDNFCCSHRCTSTVRPGQGRVRCSNTGASRSVSLFAYDLSTTFAPKSLGLVFSESLYVYFCPKADPKSTEGFRRRYPNLVFSNPTVKRIPADANQFRDFGGRIFSHLSITTLCQICQLQNRAITGADCVSDPVHREEYRNRQSNRTVIWACVLYGRTGEVWKTDMSIWRSGREWAYKYSRRS